MSIPHHPGTDDDAPTSQRTGRTAVVVALVIAVLVVFIALHLSGVVGGG